MRARRVVMSGRLVALRAATQRRITRQKVMDWLQPTHTEGLPPSTSTAKSVQRAAFNFVAGTVAPKALLAGASAAKVGGSIAMGAAVRKGASGLPTQLPNQRLNLPDNQTLATVTLAAIQP